jgi:hypothetical protein
MRDPLTETKQILIARTLDARSTWNTGDLGTCPLTGARMFLTERAARVASIAAAVAEVAPHLTAAEVAEVAERRAAEVTGSVDGAHAPVARSRGGHRVVLTDARAQQALGAEDTLGTEDAPSIDDRDRAGVTAAKRRTAEARRRLG